MKSRTAAVALVFALALVMSTFAADINGQWTATFSTQMGDRHYIYTFRVEGEKLTGTAKSDNGEVQIHDGSVKGDDVAFVEDLNFQGQTIPIAYTGKISGDEIKFTRHVGDFATEELVAKRVK